MTFSAYGTVLHSLLPHLAQQSLPNRPYLPTRRWLEQNYQMLLDSTRELSPLQASRITAEDRQQIIRYWHYIVSYIAGCQAVTFEMAMPNGARPDLCCRRDNTICLVELKTTTQHNHQMPLMTEGIRKHLKRQLRANLSYLKAKAPPTCTVHGYLLLFGVGPGTYAMAPRWFERT